MSGVNWMQAFQARISLQETSSVGCGGPIAWNMAILMAVTALAACPNMAIAQQVTSTAAAGGDAETSGSGTLEEIIVTAAKQQESLSKTAIAVSVQSQEQLQAAGVETLQELTSSIPSVQFDTQGYNDNVQASIRGITSNEGGEIAQSAVATYIDGVYVSRTSALSGTFYDLDRVEVLRGPQGTLYGRNATAGNINIITGSPSQEFGASAEVAAGNYGDVETRGMLNLPVDSTLALRGAFIFRRDDGYIDTQGTTVHNYAQADDRGVRLTALWEPVEAFKWRLSLEQFISDGTPTFNSPTAANGMPAYGESPYKVIAGTPEPSNYVRNSTLRSRMDWDAGGGFSLAYIAGVANADYDVITQWAATPGAPLGSQHSDTVNANQYHEINLTYKSDRLWNVLGANYAHEGNNDFFDNPLPGLGIQLTVDSQAAYTSWGAFDQLTYNVSSALRLTGGLRYSKDQQLYPAHEIICPVDTFFFGGPALPSGCTVSPYSTGEGSWSKVNWKAGAEYDLNDTTLTYLTVSTGYKAGGLNALAGTEKTDSTFKPEDVTNYEFGIKSRLLNDRANVNVAVFYEDYTNLQVNQFANLAYLTLNAAKAANYGAELEGRWLVTKQDHLDGFLTYLHATYQQYTNALDQNSNITYASLSGHFLPNAPEGSARLQYAHDFVLPNGGSLSPAAAVYWQAHSYLREFNLPIDLVPAYTKTILRLTYLDASGHWKGEAFVDNLEDKAVRNGELLFLGQYYSYYNPPRTYGLRLSYRH